MKGGTDNTLSDFKSYLKLERSLSGNTVEAYCRDGANLLAFLNGKGVSAPENATLEDLASFLESAYDKGISKRSQARLTSSVKALYRFLDAEGKLSDNPCDKLQAPKINPHLPEVLSVDEVFAILDSVDLSRPEGQRDRAILEVLYSCGLRVSEASDLRISNLFLGEQFIKVTGKGSKQRLVPISGPAIKNLLMWLDIRRTWPVQREAEDNVFINRKGGRLSRVSIFNLVKKQAEAAGVRKEISPHTFRHSFATHLVENGADLRTVQEMLGHESILTTEIYTHIDTRKWQETILKYHPKTNK
ncbi:MAG: tyrosine recombinase XerD [Bacteroidales bacterium]|nr:tyrosine recombinase XerD [Bacteroidales bacterium]